MLASHHRSIRSFVRRISRMSLQQKRAIETLWPQYGISPSDIKQLPPQWFTQQPCTLEIGFGMGHNLVQMAQMHPTHLFIGADVHLPGIGRVMALSAALGVENIRIANCDVKDVVLALPDQCLAKVFILFPDPWPKAKHHKRRLINTEFSRGLLPKLSEHACLYLATDDIGYANQMLAVLAAVPELQNLAKDQRYLTQAAHRFTTKFEQKARQSGRTIYELGFKRRNIAGATRKLIHFI